MPRFNITPEDFRHAKLVKPGWYPTLIKEMVEELSKAKDSMNTVIDCENADNESEFFGVPVKHWLSEKGVRFAGGAVSFIKAFNPGIDESQVASVDVADYVGRYIYAKWTIFRGNDGTGSPSNRIEDWAPLPKKYAKLADAVANVASDVDGFAKV